MISECRLAYAGSNESTTQTCDNFHMNHIWDTDTNKMA